MQKQDNFYKVKDKCKYQKQTPQMFLKFPKISYFFKRDLIFILSEVIITTIIKDLVSLIKNANRQRQKN